MNSARARLVSGVRTTLWLAGVLVAACSWPGRGAKEAAEADPVVARVGQRPILRSEVARARAQQKFFARVAARDADHAAERWDDNANRKHAPGHADAAPAAPGAQVPEGEPATPAPGDPNDQELRLRRAVLQQLIEQALLYQAAQADHVAVLADEVDAAWSAASRAWPEGELQTALRDLRVTVPEMKAQLRARLLAGKVLRAEALARVVVRDEDIDAYLTAHPALQKAPEAVQLRQIVVPDEDGVHKAQQALKQHATFGEVAARLSVAPEAAAGGELGVLTRDELPRALAEICFALRPRQVSRPVRAADGWHLFWVEERLPTRARPKAELRLVAERQLRAEGEAEAAATYLARAAREAHVEVDVERLSQFVE